MLNLREVISVALSRNEQKYDQDGDSVLRGSEYMYWEMDHFGLGFGKEEPDEIIITPKLTPEKKSREIIPIVDSAYNQFLTSTKAVLECWDEDKKLLSDKTFFHWVSKGLSSGVCLGLKKPGNKNDPVCKMYNLVVRDLVNKHPSICSYDDIEHSSKNGTALFAEEGQLSQDNAGSFWTALITALPIYHEDAVAIFGRRVRMGYPDQKSDDKVKALSNLMQAVFPMYTFFSNCFGKEADEYNRCHRDWFEAHWRAYCLPDSLPEPDPEESIKQYHSLLLENFPEFFDKEEFEQFAEYYWGVVSDLLCACFYKNPDMAVQMWRCLYETSHTKDNSEACGYLTEMMECLAEMGNNADLLDIIEKDDSLKNLIFSADHNVDLQNIIIELCEDRFRLELCDELMDIYQTYMDTKDVG